MHGAGKQAAEAVMDETTAGLAQLQPAAPNGRLKPAVAVQWQWNPLAIDVNGIDAYILLFNAVANHKHKCNSHNHNNSN